MKKAILLILSFSLIVGCASVGWMACGDRGVDSKYGFLWLKYKCIGDKWCDKCKEWIDPHYNCEDCKK